MIRRSLLMALGALVVTAAPARADGLPALPGFIDNARGIAAASGGLQFTARQSGGATLVRAISRLGILGYRVPGQWRIPVVAYDGTPSGLSRDGRTLVLIVPRRRFPQRTSRVAILDAHTLRVRSEVRLRGDFSVDAISPDGHWLYLVQYTSGSDPTHYRVRALDLRTDRLLSRVIVDPHERGEKMRGSPVTRITSADGRWAYTLYDGNKQPFVHALETTSLTARCIDVPGLRSAGSPWILRMRLDPVAHRLLVLAGRRTLAWIDLRTFAAHAVPAPARPARTPVRTPARHGSAASGGGSPWAALGLIAGLAAAGAVVVVLRRRLGPLGAR
jgi:hypothetical protein